MFIQTLEQFDPSIIYHLYDKIYISQITFTIITVMIISSIIMIVSLMTKVFKLSLYERLVNNLLFFFLLEIYKPQVIKKGQKLLIIFYTLFIFLLFSNILGLVSYGFTITSHLNIAFFFSITFFFSIIIIGFITHGVTFINILVPSGAPKMLLPFLVCIEFISYFSRVFSLAIRLFANMMAGHTLLAIISNFAIFLLFQVNMILFLLPFLIIFLLFILEMAIAFLQAYVFVVLVCIYLNDSFVLSH